jgi:hypothetical protein
LGLKASERSYSVLFATAAGLIAALSKAAAEARRRGHELYCVPRLS